MDATMAIGGPTGNDARLARDSSRALASILREGGRGCEVSLHVRTGGDHDAEVPLPASILGVLLGALREAAAGHDVVLTPLRKEMSTQEAADLLQVSRPFLIGLLEAGQIPYRRVGTHRRILHEDVLKYAQAERRRREDVMRELMAETERLGL